jgi:hypothetical protein
MPLRCLATATNARPTELPHGPDQSSVAYMTCECIMICDTHVRTVIDSKKYPLIFSLPSNHRPLKVHYIERGSVTVYGEG